jgi:hypothetical protein
MLLYIDATAGGMLLQVLLGGFTGIAVVGRLLWGRLSGHGDKQHEPDQHELAHQNPDQPEHADDDVRLAG